MDRVDERERARFPPEDVRQRPAGLPQRQIERRALERPAPKRPQPLVHRRRRVQVERRQVGGERVDRPLPGDRQRRGGFLEGELILLDRGGVLANALLAGAGQLDVSRAPDAVRSHRGAQRRNRVGLDLERQIGDERVGLADGDGACHPDLLSIGSRLGASDFRSPDPSARYSVDGAAQYARRLGFAARCAFERAGHGRARAARPPPGPPCSGPARRDPSRSWLAAPRRIGCGRGRRRDHRRGLAGPTTRRESDCGSPR